MNRNNIRAARAAILVRSGDRIVTRHGNADASAQLAGAPSIYHGWYRCWSGSQDNDLAFAQYARRIRGDTRRGWRWIHNDFYRITVGAAIGISNDHRVHA